MPRLYIALPILNENEYLHRLMSCISGQTYRDFIVYACVNQPDEWWDDPVKVTICHENAKSLEYLKTISDFKILTIDKSSEGNGWRGKRHGVGWARKIIMDAIDKAADKNDIIVSIDADTTFTEKYFQSLVNTFERFPDATGMAVPYYHKTVPDERASRAILRYEIYMRYYSLNLWRTGSPFTFTALGSAMVFPVWAYRAAGGMTPKMSGEDFYFLQKLKKTGRLIFWNEEKVYPEARFSDRVYFGTGPAMIKGDRGDWSSYPLYRSEFFDEARETCEMFPSFLRCTQTTKVTEFLRQQFGVEDPFEPLRNNFHTETQFVRACHEKFDGLRILQYVKSRHKEDPVKDESSLVSFLQRFYLQEFQSLGINSDNFSFEGSSLEQLENIRMFLLRKEEEYQVSSTLP